MCRLCVIDYVLSLRVVGWAGIVVTILGSNCDVDDNLASADFGVDSEFTGTTDSENAVACPDLASVYLGVVTTMVTGVAALLGAFGAVCGCLPPAGAKYGESHPASHAASAAASAARP